MQYIYIVIGPGCDRSSIIVSFSHSEVLNSILGVVFQFLRYPCKNSSAFMLNFSINYLDAMLTFGEFMTCFLACEMRESMQPR